MRERVPLKAGINAPTVEVADSKQIPHYPWPTAPGQKPYEQFANATRAIHKLNYSHVWGPLGTILMEGGNGAGGVRIDRQRPLPGGGKNLQVQLNGVTGVGTTVAHILIDGDLEKYSAATYFHEQNKIRIEIVRMLLLSLETGKTTLIGSKEFVTKNG